MIQAVAVKGVTVRDDHLDKDIPVYHGILGTCRYMLYSAKFCVQI